MSQSKQQVGKVTSGMDNHCSTEARSTKTKIELAASPLLSIGIEWKS